MKTPHVLVPFSLIITFLLGIYSCTVPKVDHLVIVPKHTQTKQPVGLGVSMLIPLDYKKVEAFNGFETDNNASSVRVQIVTPTVEELKVQYTPKNLKQEGLSLSEMSTVQYGDNYDAFFAKVYDKEKSAFEYVLAIEQNDKTYLIEANCTDISHDFYDYKIRQSLLSIYIN